MAELIPGLDPDARRIILDFIRDRFAGAGSDEAVIGLSGGLDSSLTLGLLADALGPDKIRAFFLPYGKLGDKDRRFSMEAAGAFSVEVEEMSISPVVDSIPLKLRGMVKGNAQARARMLMLYAVANSENGLVVGPSNKTELLMGYFTKYGDGGADIYPIGDLYKTQVRTLAREIGVPLSIIERPPSAGLIEGQTDEGEIGIPYPILDQILFGYLHGLDPEQILDSIDYTSTNVEEMDRASFELPLEMTGVTDIIRIVESSRHKRNSLAIPKLEISTVGFDLRERW